MRYVRLLTVLGVTVGAAAAATLILLAAAWMYPIPGPTDGSGSRTEASVPARVGDTDLLNGAERARPNGAADVLHSDLLNGLERELRQRDAAEPAWTERAGGI